MRPDLLWYHVIWNTLGSWLPGDPRGFRNRNHRIHSSGDYRNPPPRDEHELLFRYNQSHSRPAIHLPSELRPLVFEAVLDAIVERDCSAAAVSVAAEHVHVLAALPPNYDEAKVIVRAMKTVSSLAIREQMPGSVWSRGRTLKRVITMSHWEAARKYIATKQEPGAYTWDQDRGTGWIE